MQDEVLHLHLYNYTCRCSSDLHPGLDFRLGGQSPPVLRAAYACTCQTRGSGACHPPPPPPLENVDIWGLRSLASGAISAQSVLSMPDISIIIITCSVKCAAACRLYFDRARVSWRLWMCGAGNVVECVFKTKLTTYQLLYVCVCPSLLSFKICQIPGGAWVLSKLNYYALHLHAVQHALCSGIMHCNIWFPWHWC